MAIPNYKEILELIKTGATIEAQEKIMELRQSAIELQEQNIELRNKVIELEDKLRAFESFNGDPCPKCRQPAWVVERSEPDPTFGDLGGVRRTYKCSECGFTETAMVTPK